MHEYRVVAVGDRTDDAVRNPMKSPGYVRRAPAEVDGIHVRDAGAGCYDLCIQRVTRNEDFSQTNKASGGDSHE